MSIDQDKVKEIQILREIRKRQCEDSYYEFFKDAWEVIEPTTKLEEAWYIKYLCDVLQEQTERVIAKEPKEQDIIINIPPGSSKSSIVTKIWPVWCWVKDPSLRFLTVSYSASLSLEHGVKSRDIIESNWFQGNWGKLFQLKSDRNMKGEYGNNATGVRMSVGMTGTATGKHADIHVYDDIVNPEQTEGEAGIKKAIRIMTKTLATRFTNKVVGLRVLVMQRLAEDDPTGYLLANERPEWRLIRLPSEVSDDVNPPILKQQYVQGLLDPVRYPQDTLDKMKIQLGSFGFAGQMMQNPIPSDGNVLKRSWFGRFTMSELNLRAQEKGQKLYWNFSFDGAFTEKTDNDPSGIMAYCIFQGNLYIRSVKTVRKEFPELVEFIKEFCNTRGYTTGSRLYIEPKASGMPAAQTLVRYTKLNAILDKPPTTDKLTRAKSISAFVEAGRCFLLKDGTWVDSFLSQCAGFPNMKHDEEVDILCIAVSKVDYPKGQILSFGSL